MPKLSREYQLQISDLIIDNKLNLVWTYEVDLDNSPPVAELSIYNLSDDTISKINSNQGVLFQIGYNNNIGVMIEGYIKNSITTFSGPDKITKLKVLGCNLRLNENLSISYSRGTFAEYAIKDISKKLGLTIKILELVNNFEFVAGYSSDDKGISQLKEIVQKTKSILKIENNFVYVYSENQTITQEAFNLNYNTGLLREPLKNNDDSKKYDYEIKALPNFAIKKGSLLQIKSNGFNGLVSVKEIKISNWESTYKVGEVK